MKTSKWLVVAVVGLAMLQAGCATEGGGNVVAARSSQQQPTGPVEGKTIVDAKTKDDFAATAAAIRQQMGPGGHWQYASKLEKEKVDQHLNDMQSLFEQYGSVDQMDNATKIRLFNDQEAVNQILAKNDDRRLVCTSELPVGSHLPVKTCRTYGQIERERENAQRFLNQATPQAVH